MRVSEIINSGSFARVIEIFPPGFPTPNNMKPGQKIDLSVRFETIVQNIADLEALSDAFSLPELRDDSRVHLNSVAVAAELIRRTGSAVIPTITLRDSNKQNLLGTISFAIFSGVENIQIVRGDPYASHSESRNVYDISKISTLISIIRKLESHLLNLQKTCVFAPINLSKISIDSYFKMAKQREVSGVDIFVTESLFEDTNVYLRRVAELRDLGFRAPIIHNIFPFRDYEDAMACVKRFGWNVSAEELHGLKTKGPKFGVEMARKRYFGLVDRKEISQGACISSRGNADLIRQIVA
ncbi:MAG: methylenetetrahydrofolate reductase [Thaumarchaeota archaeon]|nr:methylenetetrahydrofolate reductase [Nitrososphaerota archaeon]